MESPLSFGLSDLQYLMHQLGPMMPEIVTIVQEDIDSWQVELDEGVSLQLGWQEQPPRLLMSCAIGRPDEAMREKVYASLLNANYLLTGITTLKLALSDPGEDVVLIGEYEAGEGSIDALQRLIVEFLRSAARFSRMVAVSQPDASANYPSLPEDVNARRV